MDNRIKHTVAHYETLDKLFGVPKNGAIFECLKEVQQSDASGAFEMEEFIQSRLGISLADQRRLASQYDMISRHIPNGASGNSAEKLYGRLLGVGEDALTIRQRGPLLENVSTNSHQYEDFIDHGGYQSAAKALHDMKPSEIVDEVRTSKLKGRGGAYFPVGAKWAAAANEKSKRKFLICNADEGEPPTRKDKLLLEQNPHLLLEGMIIVAKAIGVRLGIIYIRGDYTKGLTRVSEAIAEAEKAGWLGENIQSSGFDFDLHVFAGSGSYVAGCDTAMLESLEGKAAIPRPTPPYPTQQGLAGEPTVVNNVETLCNIPLIISMGGQAFSKIGAPDCPGTKIFGLCGDIGSPGFYELPIGIKLQNILKMAGGVVENRGSGKRPDRLKAVSPGGVTTGLLTAEEVGLVFMEPDSLAEHGVFLGSGAITVFNDQRNMLDFAEGVLEFLGEESCGNCVQCPIAIRMTQKTIARVRKGEGRPEEVQSIFHRAEMIAHILKCGLGKNSHVTTFSAVIKFSQDI